MRDLVIVASPLLMLGLLYCLWRAVELFRTWCPAVAIVWKTDYSDTERADDANTQAMLGFPLLRIDPIGRMTMDDVVFTDLNGVQRKAAVLHRVARGTERVSARTIWYDPEDPQRRVTADGPARWVLRALKCGLVLAAMLYWVPMMVAEHTPT